MGRVRDQERGPAPAVGRGVPVRRLGGPRVARGQPGRYRRLLVRPLPGPGLLWARARHDTPYGRAEAGWERRGDGVDITASVPPNATATMVLPDGSEPFDVGPGTHRWETGPLQLG